jgi:CubicO group peptidase (beta-lactamase class C family)
MRYQLFAFIAAVATASCSQAAQQAARSPDPVRAVETGLRGPVAVAGEAPVLMSLSDRMAFYKVPGVSIAVIDKGKIAWAKGYGMAREGQPVTPETQFSTGSISKAVTAVAAMRRVESGALALDADVNSVLKNWKVPPSPLSAGRPLTMRGLLSHGAGLSVHGFYPGYEPGAPLPTNIQILNGKAPAVNKPVVIEIQPGTAWKYSGGGYQVVQQWLTEERVTEFPRLMQALIFKPLGMTRSRFEQLSPEQAPVNSATAHDRQGKELPSRWMLLPELAAAGLWSTPTDLARLAVALQQSWKGKSGSLVSAATAREMFKRQIGEWGLGFELQGQGRGLRFRHVGDNPGYKAILVAFPETGQGAVILTNGDRGTRLVDELLLSVAAAYNWVDYAPKVKTMVKIDPAAISRLEGTYVLDTMSQVKLVVAARGERLSLRIVQPGGEDTSELLPAAPDRFFRRDIEFELRFQPGSPAPKLALHQDGQVFSASRTNER